MFIISRNCFKAETFGICDVSIDYILSKSTGLRSGSRFCTVLPIRSSRFLSNFSQVNFAKFSEKKNVKILERIGIEILLIRRFH